MYPNFSKALTSCNLELVSSAINSNSIAASTLAQYPLPPSNAFKLPTQPRTGFGEAATPSPITPVTISLIGAKIFPTDRSSGSA